MPKRPSAPTTEFLLPTPSPEGVAMVRDLFLRRTGREIAEGEARDLLARVMRFQYLNILINSARAGRNGQGVA